MIEIEWRDPPPVNTWAGRAPSRRQQFIAALKEQPGRWAYYGAMSISASREIMKAIPQIEATHRRRDDGKFEVYCRWIGDDRLVVKRNGSLGHRSKLAPQWLRQQIANGVTPSEMAAAAGCAVDTIYRAMRRHSITRDRSMARKTWADVLTAEYLTAEYVDAGRTLESIAAEHGCSVATVINYAKRHDINRRDRPTSGPLLYPILTADWLAAQLADGATITGMAAAAGCSSLAVSKAMDRHGIPRPTRTGRPKTRR